MAAVTRPTAHLIACGALSNAGHRAAQSSSAAPKKQGRPVHCTQHVSADKMVAARQALQAIREHYQKEQLDFCRQWYAGVPQPHGTLPNASYFRKPNIRALHGSVFRFPMYVLEEADIVSNEIKKMGSWEISETNQVLDRLREWKEMHVVAAGDVVLFDIGSNLGWFAINAAALNYSVFAFEPMAKNIGAIRRTLCESPEMSKRLTLITKGLSNVEGKCEFYVDVGNRGNGITACEGTESARLIKTQQNFEKVGEFELGTLDGIFKDAMPALEGRVAAMKIDVEGFEPQAYAGARQFFNEVRPKYILAEVNRQYDGLVAPLSLLKLYDEMCYHIHWHDFHGEVIQPQDFEPTAQGKFGPGTLYNIYLTRRQGCRSDDVVAS